MGITYDTYLLYKWKLLQDLTSDMLQDVSTRFESQMIGLKENCCSPLIHLALGSWTLKFLPKTSSTVSFPFKARLSSSPDTGDRKKTMTDIPKATPSTEKNPKMVHFPTIHCTKDESEHSGWGSRPLHELECRRSLFGWRGNNKHSVCGYYKIKTKKQKRSLSCYRETAK